jgi:predicted phosphatase
MILGADYNPLVSYYSERRTLMIPEWGWLNEDMVMRALRNLKGEKIGALLVCEPHRYPLEKLLQQCKAEGFEFPIIQSGQLPLR